MPVSTQVALPPGWFPGSDGRASNPGGIPFYNDGTLPVGAGPVPPSGLAGQQLFYSSTAVQTTVASDQGTMLNVNSVTGFPSLCPYTLLLEWGTLNQEVVTVTSAPTGNGPYMFMGVLRGQDGTTQVFHAPGAQVNHGVSARDFAQIAPVFNVVAYGADPTGTLDSTLAIQSAFTAAASAGSGVVFVPPGTYGTISPLSIPSGVTLRSATRGFGTPIDNYGVAGLPVQGAILKPSSSFSGPAVLLMDNTAGTTQAGNQQIIGISIDGSSLPGGNTVHGIESIGPVAAVTIRDCTIYKVGGNGIYANLNSSFQPADFWGVSHTRASYCGGWGFQGPGLSDSYFTDCEMTTNSSGGWLVHDQSNNRFIACKGEQSGAGPGWQIEFVSIAGGIVTLVGCHSEFNHTGGFYCTGAAVSTIVLDGCSSVGDGNGSSSSGYAGLQASGCASRVIASNFAAITATGGITAPQYGVSQVSSSYGISVTSAQLQGTSSPVHDDGSNTIPLAYTNMLAANSDAEPLTSGEAIFKRSTANANVTLTTQVMVLSYWTAATSGSATSVITATVGTAASGLTYAAVGVYSVAANGNLTLLGSTGDLHTTLWAGTFTSYTSSLSFTRVAGTRYALGVLAVGTGMPVLAAVGDYFLFNPSPPIIFGSVSGQTTLPSTVTSGSIGTGQSTGAEAVVTP